MLKLIIFDWDDVFTIGSKEGYFACYHETLVQLGVIMDQKEEEKRIVAKWSQPHREELMELLKERPELLDRACDIYEEKLFGGVFEKHLTVLDGVIPLLERLAKRYKLHIATGMHPKLLSENIIPYFRIPQVFSGILSSYDIKDPSLLKPNPYMITKILNDEKFLPSEAVLVGDAKTDVLMAQNAGVEPIVVLTGHLSRKEAQSLNVNRIIEDVTKLETILP